MNLNVTPGRSGTPLYPFEPKSFIDVIAHLNRPTSTIFKYGCIPEVNFKFNTPENPGPIDWATDEYDIDAVIEPTRSQDRYQTDISVTSNSYRVLGDTTTRADLYRVEGGVGSTGEYVAYSLDVARLMSAQSAQRTVYDKIRTQGATVLSRIDEVFYQQWFQSQQYLTHNNAAAGGDYRDGATAGVTVYEVQTDFSTGATDAVTTAEEFIYEMSQLQTTLMDKGTSFECDYVYFVPRVVINTLHALDGGKTRLVNMGDYTKTHIRSSGIGVQDGLWFVGESTAKLKTFSDTQNGVYGYMANRHAMGAQLMFTPIHKSLDLGELSKWETEEALLEAAETQRMVQSNPQSNAVLDAYMHAPGTLAGVQPADGVFGVKGNLFSVNHFSLKPISPSRNAIIVYADFTGVRIEAKQYVILRFLDSRLPAAATANIKNYIAKLPKRKVNIETPTGAVQSVERQTKISDYEHINVNCKDGKHRKYVNGAPEEVLREKAETTKAEKDISAKASSVKYDASTVK